MLQWNCYHLNETKMQELQNVIEDRKPSVVCLSEVSAVHKNFTMKKIPGYHTALVVKPEGTKGIAMFVRSNIVFQEFRIISGEDKNAYGQSIDIQVQNYLLRLCHVYVNPATNKSDRIQFWNTTSLWMNEKKLNLVVGDINENAKIFGDCNRSTTSSIDKVIKELKWNVLNDGSPTRISLNQEEVKVSALDVTITSEAMSEVGSRWSVLGYMGSDHLPILSEFQLTPTTKFIRPPENTRDWNRLRNYMESSFEVTNDLGKSTFIEILKMALEKFPPRQTKHKQCPWWDEELAYLKRRRNRAFNEGNTEEYRTVRKGSKTCSDRSKSYSEHQRSKKLEKQRILGRSSNGCFPNSESANNHLQLQ